MKKFNLGKFGTLCLVLAVASVVAVGVPSLAGGGSKLYGVTLNAVPGTLPGHYDITFTVINDSNGSAVLGSANISAVGATFTGSPSAPIASAGKTWTATRVGQTIRLRAVGDMQKINPGQTVKTTIDTLIGSGSFSFPSQAKASRDFSGNSFFNRVGSDPQGVVCGSSGGCSINLGNTSNAPPDHETGSFTLDSPCDGCVLFISETLGDFCSTSPPGACHAPFVPQFLLEGSYSGTATFVLVCDKTDCVPPPTPVCSFSCGAPTTFTEVGNFPVYFTQSNAPTNSEQTVNVLDSCFAEGASNPCVSDQFRISTEGGGGGQDDLESDLSFCFGECFGPALSSASFDPRPGV